MQTATITLDDFGHATLRFPYDAEFIARLKDGLPPHARKFNPEHKYWWVDRDYVGEAARLFERHFPHGEFVDAPSARARTAPPPPPPRAPTPLDPYAVLHLLPGAPLEVVEAAGRALAKLHHPDTKPAHEKAAATVAMARINAAIDRIRTLRRAA